MYYGNLEENELKEKMKNKKKMDVRGHDISDEGILFMKKHLVNEKIESLDLGVNSLTEKGMKELAEILRKNQIGELELAKNSIDNKGISFLCEGLKKNQHIKIINLESNLIGSDGLKCLAESINSSTLTSIDLYNNKIEDIMALGKAMKENDKVKQLILRKNRLKQMNKSFFEDMIHNKTLEMLDIAENELKSKEIFIHFSNYITSSNTLTKLVLLRNDIRSDCMDPFSKALLHNRSLTTIDLSDNRIDCEGIKFLCEGIKEHPSLESLNLSFNTVKEMGMQHLCETLTHNRSLKFLDLRSNMIGDGVQHVPAMLKKNFSLKSLNLSHNSIDKLNKEAFISIFQVNRTITELDLSMNHFGFIEIHSFLLTNRRINEMVKVIMLILRNRNDCFVSRVPRRLLFYLFRFLD
eukprot:TRINITY_DN196_c0_g2_i1.p1 TRINITY_DN196_c0_g2~~TRINITY_DN196_c0_g2_i1.p1  ORF type:complete len:409 (-),score=103.33 TRINITY_DN196_c0_g2_i1:6-1232(-)